MRGEQVSRNSRILKMMKMMKMIMMMVVMKMVIMEAKYWKSGLLITSSSRLNQSWDSEKRE